MAVKFRLGFHVYLGGFMRTLSSLPGHDVNKTNHAECSTSFPSQQVSAAYLLTSWWIQGGSKVHKNLPWVIVQKKLDDNILKVNFSTSRKKLNKKRGKVFFNKMP